MRRKRILFSVGGTGGHLFPAQVAAQELSGCEILFVGGGLSKNHFFERGTFKFEEISTAPIRFSLKTFSNLKGIFRSLRIIKSFSPDLVVGFGSFYTFPLLVAACICKVPFILHEQNAIPGKVNKMFAPFAKTTVITFPKTASMLRGTTVESVFPLRKQIEIVSPWKYFGLLEHQLTLLVYGGSQGAAAINSLFCGGLDLLKKRLPSFQVVHFAGRSEDIDKLRSRYASAGILACVKGFEPHPDVALRAADLAITRAGAGTIAELIAYNVPAILIPYPHASENHQIKNGEHFVNVVGGGWLFHQEALTEETLSLAVEKAIKGEISFKKSQIVLYKKGQASLRTLSQIILAHIL